MPGTAERDLASVELWQESLARSQRRRVLAAEARKDQTRKKTAAVAVSTAVAASPMWPSVTAVASDLSAGDAGKLARTLQHNHAERVLLEYGDESSAVAELQRELGISDDGIYGPHTRAAVKAFQKKVGLLPTGKVDVKTWLKLFPTDVIVYAPPGAKSALGVNNTDHPEWAAVSTAAAKGEQRRGKAKDAVAKLGHAAAAKAAKRGKGKSDPGTPSVHAASIGANGPAVGIPAPPTSEAPGLGLPGLLHGGDQAPGGGTSPGGGGTNPGGGGGGGSYHFPPLSSFGSAAEMIKAMIRMANRIDSRHYAYRWGGGHNAGFSGPYDCSGAVSAVLHAAGLLNRPMVSGEFMHWGAPGRGAVTIYANAGHVYMSVLGRYFGTTSMNPGGGAGWFPGAPRSGFAVVHVPFSALHFKGVKMKTRVTKRLDQAQATRDSVRSIGPLNQASTTPPPTGDSGGARAPSSTTRATNLVPAQSTGSASDGVAPSPNTQVAPAPATAPVEQVQQAQPAAPQAPAAPTPQETAQPVGGSGGSTGTASPAPAPATEAPATPQPSAPSGQGQESAVPQAPKPPATSPAPAQQGQQQTEQQQAPSPQPPATAAPQAVDHAADQAGQAAPATKPPGPPAGQGKGSTPNSGQ